MESVNVEQGPVHVGLGLAIQNERPVLLIYRKADDIVPQIRTVSPYEVRRCLNGRAECLLGYDHDRHGIRQYRVDRIVRVQFTGRVAYRPPEEV